MMMKKIKLDILKLGINGEGIGFWQQKPVFVDNALANETVIVDQMQNFGRYYKANLVKVINPSKVRVPVKCGLYNKCGGCNLLHCTYKAQLQFKQDYLMESLNKYCKEFNPKVVKDIIGSHQQFGYRNHAKLILKKYSGKWHAGLYQNNSNQLITIDHNCHIHDHKINEIIHKVLDCLNNSSLINYDHQQKNGLRGLAIRILDNQCSIALVSGKQTLDASLIDSIVEQTQCTVLAQVINVSKNMVNMLDGTIHYLTKQHHLTYFINGLTISVNPLSFFQLNTDGLLQMIHAINEYLPNNVRLFEGYCGVGLLSLALHNKISYGVGVEIIDQAIVAARKNASNNHIKQIFFKTGDSSQEFKYEHKKNHFDCVLVDPPRSGLDEPMVESLIKSNVSTIIYVSCNPSTLAKNLNDLSKRYKVSSIQPIDMFPNTMHVETVCLLSKLNVKKHINVKLDLDEFDLTSAESKATYQEIKKYILDKYNLKVSSLNIAQVKEKLGIKERDNYNKPKHKDSKQPSCPKEKETVIKESLKHFQMI